MFGALVTADSPVGARVMQLECFGAAATMVGNESDNQLRGTSGADVIVGLGGNDIIDGFGGNDRLCGGEGAFDLVSGGPGDDLLDGGEETGSSPLDVGDGDLVSHLASNVAVNVDLAAGRATGEGTDAIRGFEGVAGSQLSDTLVGDEGPNSFFGVAGDDVIRGGGGMDSASFGLSPRAVRVDLNNDSASGEGADRLIDIESVSGTDFNDVLVGDSGENNLFGNGGDDQIAAGAGRDGLAGGAGDDQLAAGADQDIVNFVFSRTGVTADLAAGRARGEGMDTISGIEHVIGSPFGDTFSGNSNPNSFTPLGGDDVVQGRGGRDDVTFAFSSVGVRASLTSGAATGEGSDRMAGVEDLVGSIHADVLGGGRNANALFGASGADVISGGAGGDLLVGDFPDDPLAGADRLRGEGGDDFFMGGARDDEFAGGPGAADQATYVFAPRGVTASLATGRGDGDGTDRISGVEALSGSQFADVLSGDGRSNRISGDAGDDKLSGGGSDDFLRGGTGADVLDAASGRDYCLDERSGRACEIRGLPSESPGRRLEGLFQRMSGQGPRGSAQSVERSTDVGKPSCSTASTRTLSSHTPEAVLRPPPRRRRGTMSISPPQHVRPRRTVPISAELASGRLRGFTASRPLNVAGDLRSLERLRAKGPAWELTRLTRQNKLIENVARWGTLGPSRALQAEPSDPARIEIVTWRAVLYRYDARRRRWKVHTRMPPAIAAVNASGAASWVIVSVGSLVRSWVTGRPPRLVSSLSVGVGTGRFAWFAEIRSGTGSRVADWAEPHVRLGSAGRGLFQPWCDFDNGR